MASQSRSAQEKLTELEKESAPFEEQLVEAAKFIGIDLNTVGRLGNYLTDAGSLRKVVAIHGREEWLLRWLLKKLQSPKDDIPRKTPSSWYLLCHVIQTVPLPNSARTLNERKFMSILRQTLEEAQKVVQTTSVEAQENRSDSNSTIQDENRKVSKKRKRTGELVTYKESTSHGVQELLDSIFATVNCMIQSTISVPVNANELQNTVFSAEYMRSVIRTSVEESAKILGAWLSLSSTVLRTKDGLESSQLQNWLSTFIQIWNSRAAGGEDTIQFSLNCTGPLLSLFRVAKETSLAAGWIIEMEQLIARNIILPAKTGNNTTTEDKSTTRARNNDLDILRTLTRAPVLLDSANAPLLFDIAIRSLQPHGARRRRAQDEAWLGQVFNTLVEPIPSERSQSSEAVCLMLQSAIDHKVILELSVLRSVTASTLDSFASTGKGNWRLLATIIDLDGNVFLIPNEDKDLLQILLEQITTASLDSKLWPGLREQIIKGVLIPLMKKFAVQGRDLTGFVKHWYAQLTAFETKSTPLNSDSLSAWEEDALQDEVSKLLEPLLTITQIAQLLDWLESEVKDHAGPATVILDAIASSISSEDTVDVLGERLGKILVNNVASFNDVNERYKWRYWRIITKTLQWAKVSGIDELEALLSKKALPFSTLIERGSDGSESLFGKVSKRQKDQTLGPRELETLEQFRCACAIWDISRTQKFADHAEQMILGFLQKFQHGLKSFTKAVAKGTLQSNPETTSRTTYSTSPGTLSPDSNWLYWSAVQCVMVEYPRAFALCVELPEGQFKGILQNVFYLASRCKSKDECLATAFNEAWTSLLSEHSILSNPNIIRLLVAVMLDKKTHEKGDQYNNSKAFAAESLQKLPLELLIKKDRENIMTKWLPTDSSENISADSLIGLDPVVLALVVKTMHRSPVYDDMKFHDLVNVAKAVAHSTKPRVALSLFQMIARTTLSHVTASSDQGQNSLYIRDSLEYIKENVGDEGQWVSKPAHNDYSAIKLAEVVFAALSSKSELLDSSDIISSKDFAKITKALQKTLLGRLKKLFRSTSSIGSDDDDEALDILCTINAINVVGVDEAKLAKLSTNAESRIISLEEAGVEIGERLEAFMTTHSGRAADRESGQGFRGDTSSTFGREVIRDRIASLLKEMNELNKLKLLQGLLGDDWAGRTQLDKLYAMRHVIVGCEDSRTSPEESDDEDETLPFTLSTVYSVLCKQLYQTTSIRQFCLISETLQMMLRTKGRTLSQYNIDLTLGCISILCSRSAPALSSKRAGTIYLHLCSLLREVLTSHRLKLHGHFHLVLQVMQALLRLLYKPHIHTSQAFLKQYAPPCWLPQQSNVIHPLGSIHAKAFTRLLTLICDPTTSSVTRSKQNPLNSATQSAKKIAGQHMHFVLTLYVKLQLEMRMLPEVREKMVPGIYAIFDTTSPEMRRMISDGLDSSGRVIFTGLFRDWQKFGQWTGS